MAGRIEHDGFYLADKALGPDSGHGLDQHPTATITLVTAGSLEERFAGGARRCERGAVLFKPARIAHTTRAGPRGVRMLIIGLRRPMLDDRRLGRIDQALQLRPSLPSALILAAFHESSQRQALAGSPPERALKGRVAALVEQSEQRTAYPRSADTPAWLTEVHDLLLRKGCAARSAVLARQFRVHPVYMARAFRRHYGCSIKSFARRCRIDGAVSRLMGGDASLSEVALEAGYSDQSHFSREFKQAIGISPGRTAGAWRRFDIAG